MSGKVAIVTGGGRGLGRSYCLALAATGHSVVVNDLGGDLHGEGGDPAPAAQVVAEICAEGGKAIANGADVSDWDAAQDLIESAVREFGGLTVLVNNAGILRDRLFANMSEEDWDAVIRVHLKGHAAPSRHAMAYWRAQSKAGATVHGSIVHTTSLAGLIGNFGQANYAAAKMAVVGLSHTLSREGEKYGIRSNAVSPSARTRIEASLGLNQDNAFDTFDPGNVAPFMCWLAEEDCPASGQVFHVYGDRIEVLAPVSINANFRNNQQWTVEAIDKALRGRLPAKPQLTDFVPELGEGH